MISESVSGFQNFIGRSLVFLPFVFHKPVYDGAELFIPTLFCRSKVKCLVSQVPIIYA